jgi:hypothetical protein
MQRWFGRNVDIDQSATGTLSMRSFRATPVQKSGGVIALQVSWNHEDDACAQRALALITKE